MPRPRCSLLAVVVLLACVALRGAAPSELGFDPARLARLDAAIAQTIETDRLAGAVMLILREGQPAHFKAYGLSDREAGTPMSTDAIMRIASMSKAITTAAAMMLYEEGHFMLHDPIANYLPEFAQPVVAEASSDGRSFTTEPAREPIRVIHLLTHTAGLTYGDGPARALYEKANLTGWYFADHDETIAEAVARLATLPLHAHPGERYQYGFSTDVLGRFVEAVSGQPLDQFLSERIFVPLRMVDTSFFLTPEKADRLVPVYGYENGELTVRETRATSDYLHGPRKCFSGGAGLLSTAADCGRFLQMLLNGGELDGVRLLSPHTVELMRADHRVPGFDRSNQAFGLGFWVITDPGMHGELGSAGSYGWGSAYYPQYLVDPKERMVALLMTQLMPTGGLPLNQRFKVLTYQALVEPAARAGAER